MIKKKVYFIGGIVLYAVAGLLLIYSVWAFIHCADIISQAKTAGQLAETGSEYDIMSFYMSNCLQYSVYALLLAAAGLIVQKKDGVQSVDNSADVPADRTKNTSGDAELDEWFEESGESMPETTGKD